MPHELSDEAYEKLDALWAAAARQIRERDYFSAIESLKFVLKLDPRNPTAHNRLGITYAKLGSLQKSTRHFKRANRYEPSVAACHNLGLIYHERGKYKKAKHFFEKALQLDPEPLASRHIAAAKAYEKLGETKMVLFHLKHAASIEPNRVNQLIFIDAYAKYEKNTQISDELVAALQHNRVSWDFEAFENFPLQLAWLRLVHSATEKLVHGHSRRTLSLRSRNAHHLAIVYLHNLSACINLLEKNYSLASINLARSMFEVYLKVEYGLRSKTNRGFAEIERSSVKNKLNATLRLFKHLPADDLLQHEKVKIKEQLIRQLKSLDRRYSKLQPLPSYRQIALLVDNGLPGRTFFLYEDMYEKGSDVIHAESRSIKRTATLSGTTHAGIFNDSYELLTILRELTLEFGNLYCTLPDVTKTARRNFKADISRGFKGDYYVPPMK